MSQRATSWSNEATGLWVNEASHHLRLRILPLLLVPYLAFGWAKSTFLSAFTALCHHKPFPFRPFYLAFRG